MKPRHVLIAAVVTAVLLSAAWFGRLPFTWYATSYWASRLKTADPAEANDAMQQLAALGEPAIPALAAALASDRPPVAQAAGATLAAQLGAWQRRGLAGLAAQQRLVECLASHMEHYGPAARDTAAELACEVLRKLPDAALASRLAITAACEQIERKRAEQLELAAHVAAMQATATDADERTPAGGGPHAATATGPKGSADEAGVADDAEVRSGEPAQLSGDANLTTARRLRSSAATDDLLGEPGRLPFDPALPHPIENVLRRPANVRSLSLDAASADARRVPPGDIAAQVPVPASDGAAQRALPSEPSGPARRAYEGSPIAAVESPVDPARDVQAAESEDPSNDLRQATEREVMQTVAAGPPPQRAAARAELIRRGFSEVECTLAERLYSSDVSARLEMLQLLPTLGSVNIRAWLLRFCDDPDSQVRQSAIAFALTAGDPTLVTEAQRLASIDADPQIRSLAEKRATARGLRRGPP